MPASDDSSPPSNFATTVLPQTGDRPGSGSIPRFPRADLATEFGSKTGPVRPPGRLDVRAGLEARRPRLHPAVRHHAVDVFNRRECIAALGGASGAARQIVLSLPNESLQFVIAAGLQRCHRQDRGHGILLCCPRGPDHQGRSCGHRERISSRTARHGRWARKKDIEEDEERELRRLLVQR